MKSELFKLFKSLDIKNLTDNDKEELLRIFMVVENVLIRDQIAFIFADIHYENAIPFILKMINKKETFNNNGSLVYSLSEFNMQKYFFPLINIICKQGYEARLNAIGILEGLVISVTKKNKRKGIEILEKYKKQLEQDKADKGDNSTLHFIDATQKLLIEKE